MSLINKFYAELWYITLILPSIVKHTHKSSYSSNIVLKG